MYSPHDNFRFDDNSSSPFGSASGPLFSTFGGQGPFGAMGNSLGDHPLIRSLRNGAQWLLGIGVAAVILGLVVALWPHATITVLAIAVGVLAVAIGVTLFAFGRRIRALPILPMVFYGFGLLALLVGLMALINPTAVGMLVVLMFGFVMITQGVTSLTVGRALALAGGAQFIAWHGVLSIILGLLFVFAPLTSLYSITVMMGVLMSLSGFMLIIGALRGRGYLRRLK